MSHIDYSQLIAGILRGTPTWVWVLLAVFTFYGLSQTMPRRVKLTRVLALPIAMTVFSIWGNVSAFGASPMFGYVMLMWMFVASAVLALVATMEPPARAHYDAASRTFAMPGSWAPLLLFVGIFTVKYAVSVALAIQPVLGRDETFTLAVAAVYGLFTGAFVGRAARLWRLAARTQASLQPA